MAGKIQKQDVKTLTELISAGASASDLINDTQIYVTAGSINKQLSQAITDGDIGASTPVTGIVDYFLGSIDLSVDTTGISTYDDGAGPYVDGTGGTPSALTISRRTINPLVDGGDLQISKSASSATGEGVTLLSSNIDPADRGRKLWIRFEWDGTAANYPSNDLKAYAFDVTNSEILPVIPVSGFLLDSNSVASLPKMKTQVLGYIIPKETCQQVRVSLHCLSDNAAASSYDVFLARPRLSPEASVPGAIVTEWVDFPSVAAGTLITATTTDPAYGTVVYNRAQWRRVGEEMEIRWYYRQSNNTGASAGSGIYLFNLPPGYQIDLAKLNSNVASSGTGHADFRTAAVGYYSAHHDDAGPEAWGASPLSVHSTTQLKAAFHFKSNTVYGFGLWGSSYGQFTQPGGLSMEIRASVPIVGWSSSAALSTTEVGLQTVQALAEKTSGSHTSSGSYQDVSWTKTFDNFNCFDGTTFVCNKAGRYRVESVIEWTSNTTGNRGVAVLLNGSIVARAPNLSASVSSVEGGIVSTTLNLIRGDQVKIQAFQSSGGSLAYATTTPARTRLSITEVPDFTVFSTLFDNADVELYLDVGNGYGSSGTRIRRFTNIRKQTGQGLYYNYQDSSSNGMSFTILIPGVYHIKYIDRANAATAVFGLSVNAASLSTDVNSLTYSQGKRSVVTSPGGTLPTETSIVLRLSAGDVVRAHAGSVLPDGTSDNCIFQATRIGN